MMPKEISDSHIAEAAMRVLKKNDHKLSKVGDTVFLKSQAALHIVLAF